MLEKAGARPLGGPGVDSSGNHAKVAEVSLAQHYQPDAIKHARMHPKVAPRRDGFFDSADDRAFFPDGRIGSDPSLSTPEHGEQPYQTAVADMSEAYAAFLAY